ncbi:unnamed protein product, partial [Ectocarpus fasciculatus]
IRNVGIVAHIDAGKTTTSEQMLYMCGEIKSVGRVDSGDTVLDYLPQERERGITISSAAISFKWKDKVINLIDTPGHVDFTVEVERCVSVMDGAVAIIDAVSGVQAQTRTVWKQCQKRSLPAIAFVNKMDREGASLSRALNSLRTKLSINAIPLQYPIGQEDSFEGVVDLIGMNRLIFNASTSTRNPVPPTITKLLSDDPDYEGARAARVEMMESIAEIDESFMDLYLAATEKNEVGDDEFAEEILCALRRVCISGSGVPLMCGSALKGKGIEPLLDAVSCFLPSPADRPNLELSHSAFPNKLLEANASSPMVALAFKLVFDKARGGTLAFVRIFSGKLQAKDVLYNSSKKKRERVNQLFKISADELIPIGEVEAGDIACIVGTKDTVTGDTMVIEKSPVHAYVLSGLTIPDAVYSLSIEPAKSSQQTDLENALAMMCLEDPSLRVEVSEESGQTLIKGIGELHLEIVCDRLNRQYGIEVTTGKAYVAYRESIDPDMGEISEEFIYDKQIGTKRLYAVLDASITPAGSASDAFSNVSPSSFKIDQSVVKSLTAPQLNGLESGLRGALERGPSGYPIVGLNVTIRRVETDADSSPGAIQACVSGLVTRILRESGHGVILEPVMLLEADIPEAYTGDVLGDLSGNRRGVVKEVVPSTDGSRNNLTAHVPLAPMLGYASGIRSATKGEGSFSIEFMGYQRVVDTSYLNQI